MAASPFTRKTLAFLRALKRNNDREWFRARKPDYEQHVRGPMVALLGQLARDLPAFAPDLISDPRVCLFRIYRDTRFSHDKRPLKTNVAAHFPSRKFPKGAGAGLYVEIAPQWVWMGGGIYMPEATELHAIRAAIADDHRTFHRIVTAPPFRAAVGELGGEQLSRVPRGYLKDHPAADYLRHKQFIGGREHPAEFACSPRFYVELLKVFRGLAPLVGFLNTAILSAGTRGLRDEGTTTRFYASLGSLVP
ncbi:MAG: hypothetical protein DMF88_22650 [Acidobacteria bacterium]|nr:MAG: hypothetical protein DMF88_22650 [Acidobacteriota bacterium]